MTQLLFDPQERSIAPQAESTVEKIHSDLTDLETDSLWQRLTQRKRACQRAGDLADEHPSGARVVTPVLMSILAKECRREYPDTVTELVVSDSSKQTQIAASRAIAAVATGNLVTDYVESDHSFDTFLNQLATTFAGAGNLTTQSYLVETLAEISHHNPADVADHLWDERILEELLTFVGKRIDPHSQNGVTRLLALTTTRHSSKITSDTSVIQNALDDISGVHNEQTQAYFWLVRKAAGCLPVPENQTELGEHDDLYSFLVDCASRFEENGTLLAEVVEAAAPDQISTESFYKQADDENEYKGFSQVFGELIIQTISEETPQPLSELVREVKNTTGLERRFGAFIVGVHLQAGGSESPEVVMEYLVEGAHIELLRDKTDAKTRMVGKYVAITEVYKEIPAGSDVFNKMQESKGKQRDIAAQALGALSLASFDGTIADESDSLTENLQNYYQLSPQRKVRFNRLFNSRSVRKARTLGRICSVTEEINSEKILADLIRDFKKVSGTEREWAANTIGEFIVARDSTDSLPVVEALSPIIERQQFQDRRYMTQGLGFAIVSKHTDRGNPDIEIPHTLVKEQLGLDSTMLAEALGTLIEAEEQITKVHRRLFPQAIGVLLAERQIETISPVVEALSTHVGPSSEDLGASSHRVGDIILSVVKSAAKNSIYYPVFFRENPEDIALVKLLSSTDYDSHASLDDLVDRAKNSISCYGLVCYAIGEQIAAQQNQPVGIDCIAHHVQESTGAKRAQIARVLAFVYVLSNTNQPDSILSSFIRVLNETTYSVYPILKSIIDELSVTVEDFLSALNEALEAGSADTEHTESVVKLSLLDDTPDEPHSLTHPTDSTSSHLEYTYNIQPYLEADKPIPNHALTAFIRVLKRTESDEGYPGVRSQLRAYLEASGVPTETRLKAIEVLSHL